MFKKIMPIILATIIVAVVAIPVLTSTVQSTQVQIGNPEDGNPDNDLYVFIFAGQSQSVYRNADVTVANENPSVREGQAYYYGTSVRPTDYNSSWRTWDMSTLDIYSMTDSNGDWRIGSLEAPFASTFVNATGKSILTINVGINDRDMESFIENGEGYQYATTLIEDALSKIPQEFNVILGGVSWLQGQANKWNTTEYYVQEFGHIYDQYRAIGFNGFMIEQPRFVPTVDKANLIICQTYSGCYIGSTSGVDKFLPGSPYLSPDQGHYNQSGRNIVGTDLANCYINKINRDIAWRDTIPSQTLSLVNLVPILILAGLIIGVVGSIIRNRD